jgi:peptidylprolyl isomerase
VRRLIVREVKRGRGPAVRPGDQVWADYIEANYTKGMRFNGGWKHGATENLVLIHDVWMRGLIRGMTGMRAGGRRQIIVPRHLSDVHPGDGDRAGYSYRQIVYWDVVLRQVVSHNRPRPGVTGLVAEH